MCVWLSPAYVNMLWGAGFVNNSKIDISVGAQHTFSHN